MNMTDHPLAQKSRVPRVKRQLSRDDIGNQGRVLLNDFICDRLRDVDGADIAPTTELQEPGTPSGPPLEHVKEIGRALRCIADELDNDQQIQRAIDKVPPDAPQQTFFNIANSFFDDGVMSWSRVVTLFYFGYKMALKALDKVPLIRAIINWVINFIVDRVSPWIIERGGWEAIVEYFGTPKGQAVGILVGGFAVAGAVVVYKVWGH